MKEEELIRAIQEVYQQIQSEDDGWLTSHEIADAMDVTPQTVRRHLKMLHRGGHLETGYVRKASVLTGKVSPTWAYRLKNKNED